MPHWMMPGGDYTSDDWNEHHELFPVSADADLCHFKVSRIFIIYYFGLGMLAALLYHYSTHPERKH